MARLRRRMIDLEERHAGARQPRRARVVARAEDHDLADRQSIDGEPDEPIEIRDAQREPQLHRREPRIEPLRDLVARRRPRAVSAHGSTNSGFSHRLARARYAHTISAVFDAELVDVHVARLYHFFSRCATRPLYAAVTRIDSSVAAFCLLRIPGVHVGVILAHQLAIRRLDLRHLRADAEIEHAIPLGDLRLRASPAAAAARCDCELLDDDVDAARRRAARIGPPRAACSFIRRNASSAAAFCLRLALVALAMDARRSVLRGLVARGPRGRIRQAPASRADCRAACASDFARAPPCAR